LNKAFGQEGREMEEQFAASWRLWCARCTRRVDKRTSGEIDDPSPVIG
jgi:hypothetical protein